MLSPRKRDAVELFAVSFLPWGLFLAEKAFLRMNCVQARCEKNTSLTDKNSISDCFGLTKWSLTFIRSTFKDFIHSLNSLPLPSFSHLSHIKWETSLRFNLFGDKRCFCQACPGGLWAMGLARPIDWIRLRGVQLQYVSPWYHHHHHHHLYLCLWWLS